MYAKMVNFDPQTPEITRLMFAYHKSTARADNAFEFGPRDFAIRGEFQLPFPEFPPIGFTAPG